MNSRTTKDTQRNIAPKSKKLKIKIKEIEIKIKPHKDGKYTENLDIVCYYVVFEFLDSEEGAMVAKRHLNINAAKLIEHKYFVNA